MIEPISNNAYQPKVPQIKTTHAVLLHTQGNNSTLTDDMVAHVVNASLHEIQDGALQPGAIISKDSLVKLLMAGEESRSRVDDWIEPNLLTDSANYLIWYQPEKMRHIIVRSAADAGNKQDSFYVKFPATLFVFERNLRHLKMFGLDSDKRPTLDSTLYQLPIGNVSSNGALCFGNTLDLIPDNPNGQNCHLIERCFFDAVSTHTNTSHLFLKDKEENKRTLFTQVIMYWKKKAKSKHRVNVKKDLIPLFKLRSLMQG
jgi:PRTRC genetic system protein B